jgi:prepilin-type N-terminal cleavage/methylation domain-containing protein
MKTQNQVYHRRPGAFTLMELLIVISIIAILAALIFPVGAALKNKAALNKAKAEVKQVAELIEQYKLQYGYYPPDHQTNPGVDPIYNTLYFELVGSTYDAANSLYTSLDGAAKISAAECGNLLGISGPGSILNATKSASEEAKPAKPFLREIKPGRYYEYASGSSTIRLLTCSVPWSDRVAPIIPAAPTVNPFRYIKSSTNNPGGFELWVDVIAGGKTNRISNWNPTVQTFAIP